VDWLFLQLAGFAGNALSWTICHQAGLVQVVTPWFWQPWRKGFATALGFVAH